jgi:hypothetical protein
MLPNPNATQNRVPSQQELRTLRSIAQSKAQLSEIIQARILEATSLYEDAMARCHSQQLVLDSLLSEVHTAKNFIGTLEAQKKNLDDETNELRGLIHPVRRCSPEVLAHIFGMTTTPIAPGDSIASYRAHTRQIYQIMGVCRHWRDAALHCPAMWTAIPIRLDAPLADIKSLWKCYVERVKHVPVSICLSNIGVNRKPADTHIERSAHCASALDICDLQRVPYISNLRLESPLFNEDFSSSLPDMTHFPSGKMESLSLVGRCGEIMDPPAFWWTWDDFLRLFPPFTNLEVQGAREFSLRRETGFPAVKKLILRHFEYCTVQEVLPRFPNVEVLHIGPITLLGRSTSVTSIELPHLLYLSIEGNGCIPWGMPISAPNLRSFCLLGDDTELVTECGAFLTSCPLLVSVKLNKATSLDTLVHVTNRLVHLSLELYELVLDLFISWWQGPFDESPFPQLKTLTLNYTMSRLSSVPIFHFFDDLVTLRCLPHSNAKSRLHPSLSPLEVLAITHPAEIPCAWMDSIHYETATTRLIGEVPDCQSVTLSWVLREAEVLSLKLGTDFLLLYPTHSDAFIRKSMGIF